MQGGGGKTSHWHITGSTNVTKLTQIGTGDSIATTNLSIDYTGKVGIKKLYPTTELEVAGDISASGTVYADSFQATSGSVNSIEFNDDLFITGDISASGNISFAATRPQSTLSVKITGTITSSKNSTTIEGGGII